SVASAIANAEKNRLIFELCLVERLFSPGVPIHNIMGVLKQIRARRIDQAICVFVMAAVRRHGCDPLSYPTLALTNRQHSFRLYDLTGLTRWPRSRTSWGDAAAPLRARPHPERMCLDVTAEPPHPDTRLRRAPARRRCGRSRARPPPRRWTGACPRSAARAVPPRSAYR